ncbi:MAG: hypothetical protein ACO1N0_16365 [Fluviicola sp.]
MKIRVHYGFMALLVIVLASCSKSNTNKIANNWSVVSSEEEQTSINEDGDKDYTRTSYTETTISTHSESTPFGEPTTFQESSGKVSANFLNIKKDGTWIWNLEYTFEGIQGGMQVYTNIKTIESGTWNFTGKTKGDDFKKNERIAFNILKKSTSVFQYQDQVLAYSNGNEASYLTGENMLIYTIVKSKKNELQLEQEKNNQSTMNGDVNTYKSTRNMTLKAQ